MDGLSLPDVVKHLLKESGILRWDPDDGTYEVLHGEKFESRFVRAFFGACYYRKNLTEFFMSLQIQ